MPPLNFQLLAAFVIWLITLSGGFSAFYLHKRNIHPHFTYFAEAFAGGIFLGAALFHMLPDAENALHHIFPEAHYPLANLICALGFCLLLFLEQITEYLHDKHKKTSPNLIPQLLTLLISVHALSEGIALGVTQEMASIIIIFIAIAAHKSSEGFAVAIQLKKSTLPFKKILILFFLFSLMSPLGVMLGTTAHHAVTGNTSELLTGIFNAFAAGTFLYIATLHKLHHKHEYAHLGELFLTLIGLSIMAVVAVWL
jgi:zinc transporter 1/2/3